MSDAITPTFRIAFPRTLPARFAERVQAYVEIPYAVILDDDAGIVSRLPDVNALVTLAFTREMERRPGD